MNLDRKQARGCFEQNNIAERFLAYYSTVVFGAIIAHYKLEIYKLACINSFAV